MTAGRPGRPRATWPDDDEYLTLKDFAKLPTSAQIAVWEAAARGLVESVPAANSGAGPHRYNRNQVRAVLRSLGRPAAGGGS